MSEEEAARLSTHFRSKVEEARRSAKDSGGMISFYQVMKETLDYRKWFEFQLFSQKKGERIKELTNSVFGTFSGGEKAMSMYVPLFSAVVAKYQGGRADAPRLVSLDEAFAGVDNRNIRDMFRLMTEFSFDFRMLGFFSEKNMVQVPLNIISEWESIECIDNEIYVVENPSVFAAICKEKIVYVHEWAAKACQYSCA